MLHQKRRKCKAPKYRAALHCIAGFALHHVCKQGRFVQIIEPELTALQRAVELPRGAQLTAILYGG